MLGYVLKTIHCSFKYCMEESRCCLKHFPNKLLYFNFRWKHLNVWVQFQDKTMRLAFDKNIDRSLFCLLLLFVLFCVGKWPLRPPTADPPLLYTLFLKNSSAIKRRFCWLLQIVNPEWYERQCPAWASSGSAVGGWTHSSIQEEHLVWSSSLTWTSSASSMETSNIINKDYRSSSCSSRSRSEGVAPVRMPCTNYNKKVIQSQQT